MGEYATFTIPVIRTFKQNGFQKRTIPSPRQGHTPDLSLKRKLCGQLGHDGDSDGGYIVFGEWTLCQQASKRVPEADIKTNTRKYLQMIKRCQSDTRQRTPLCHQTKSLEALNQTADTAAIIHSL